MLYTNLLMKNSVDNLILLLLQRGLQLYLALITHIVQHTVSMAQLMERTDMEAHPAGCSVSK